MKIKLVKELIEKKKYIELQESLSQVQETNLAKILTELDAPSTLLVFRILPKDLAVEVFAHLEKDKQLEILDSFTDKEVELIIEELFFDDMIDLIEEMPANIVKKILAQSKDDERELINQFLMYPSQSAGSLMTIEYVELRKHMRVKEALDQIKRIGLNKETIYTCYVTDQDRFLEGVVSLRSLVISDEEELIENLMDRDVIKVQTHDDQEEVAKIFQGYGFLALPVVDTEGRLTGIITVDDIIAVIEQEATEDFQLMAAMSPSEEDY